MSLLGSFVNARMPQGAVLCPSKRPHGDHRFLHRLLLDKRRPGYRWLSTDLRHGSSRLLDRATVRP
jgi:hypothetical protein